ncbi:hypothetical protein I317_00198 [Kwoniella heveanensis CBS 569]|nr:hypothetical protein I317_00198 [Kwoniella heveanensis CBS 569]
MSLLNSSLAGANYMTSNNDDRESSTNGAAEFTRRKKWPEILLKELVGGSIFCLKPVLMRKGSGNGQQGSPSWGWRIIYSSPAVTDMLGQKPADLEGRDFLDLVFAADHPQVQSFFMQLLTPSLKHHNSSSTTVTTSSASLAPTSQPSQGHSQGTYVRMIGSSSSSSSTDTPSSSEGSTPSKIAGPIVWEIRAHASGLGDEPPNQGTGTGTENFGQANQGTVVPQSQANEGMKGKAIWVMGRRVAEGSGDSAGGGGVQNGDSSGSSVNGNGNGNGNSGNGNGNGQSLDAFLELKLENERLREELRELQLDLDEDIPSRKSSYPNTSPTKPNYVPSSSPSSKSSSSDSSRSSSPSRPPNVSATTTSKPKIKSVGRPPKDKEGNKEKRRKKSMVGAIKEGEGMHVCVTCGRTDSPEWRKGPLGPKTLCNACGLRWAKRNSAQPSRKDRKPNDGKK